MPDGGSVWLTSMPATAFRVHANMALRQIHQFRRFCFMRDEVDLIIDQGYSKNRIFEIPWGIPIPNITKIHLFFYISYVVTNKVENFMKLKL